MEGPREPQIIEAAPDNDELRAVVAGPLGEVATAASMSHRVRLPKSRRQPAKAEALAEPSELEPAEELELDLDEIDIEATRGADSVRVYLNEAGKTPLINAAKEVELSKRIEAGLFADRLYKKIKGETKEALTDEEKAFVKREQAKVAKYLKEQGRTDITPKAELLRELRAVQVDGANAKDHLLRANLRLVISLAKRYTGHGMEFIDLIQEGNIGLIRAVEKFDYAKGFKFSTYATWWIRQAISRAMADQSRTIRIPVHMVEQINKMNRIRRELAQTLGEDPSDAVLARELHIGEDKVRELKVYDRKTIDLDMPIGEDSTRTLGDYIVDDTPDTGDLAARSDMYERLERVIDTLEPREQMIIRMRYGIGSGHSATLDEIGEAVGVTRERIRQIEQQVKQKLRHPSRLAILGDYQPED